MENFIIFQYKLATFDPNGNITDIYNYKEQDPNYIHRHYRYDDLNRLTRAENTPDPNGSYTTFEYQYDPIGNMTYKSDVGFMSYGTPAEGAGPALKTSQAPSTKDDPKLLQQKLWFMKRL